MDSEFEHINGSTARFFRHLIERKCLRTHRVLLLFLENVVQMSRRAKTVEASVMIFDMHAAFTQGTTAA